MIERKNTGTEPEESDGGKFEINFLINFLFDEKKSKSDLFQKKGECHILIMIILCTENW